MHRARRDAIAREYSELYEFAPLIWLVLDASGIIRDINPAGCQALEIEKSFIVGTPFRIWVVARAAAAPPRSHAAMPGLRRAGRDDAPAEIAERKHSDREAAQHLVARERQPRLSVGRDRHQRARSHRQRPANRRARARSRRTGAARRPRGRGREGSAHRHRQPRAAETR